MRTTKTTVHKKRPLPASTDLRTRPLPPGDDLGAAELARRVGTSIREKRKARGLSLDLLAKASGVSRAALSQVETQKCSPSLGVLWKISVGLGIPFSDLLGSRSSSVSVQRRADSQVLRSADGRMESRPLAPAGSCPWAEAYELKLAPRSIHLADPHAHGTREILIVLSGRIRMHAGSEIHTLTAGDSISFMADQPHGYENPTGSEARCHDIILYLR
jgi:transcriptional regulator with XRE-family HTH domain